MSMNSATAAGLESARRNLVSGAVFSERSLTISKGVRPSQQLTLKRTCLGLSATHRLSITFDHGHLLLFRLVPNGAVCHRSFFPSSERFLVEMAAAKKFREHAVFRAEQIGREKDDAEREDDAGARWKIEPIRNEEARTRAEHAENTAAPK